MPTDAAIKPRSARQSIRRSSWTDKLQCACDIETGSQEDLVAELPDIPEPVLEEAKAPKGWKDQVKIKAFLEKKTTEVLKAYKVAMTKTAEDRQQQILDMSLDPNWGRVIYIACHGADGVLFSEDAFNAEQERKLLQIFWEWISERTPELVTFNGKWFDVPFLLKRSWYQNVKPTVQYDTQRWRSNNHFDLMLILNQGERRKGNLELLTRRKLGWELPFKDIHPYQLLIEGRTKDIQARCEADAKATWALWVSRDGYFPDMR